MIQRSSLLCLNSSESDSDRGISVPLYCYSFPSQQEGLYLKNFHRVSCGDPDKTAVDVTECSYFRKIPGLLNPSECFFLLKTISNHCRRHNHPSLNLTDDIIDSGIIF